MAAIVVGGVCSPDIRWPRYWATRSRRGKRQCSWPGRSREALNISTDRFAIRNRDDSKDKAKYRLEMDRSIYGTVNGGGADFELRTFNGEIYLRKAK